MESPNIDFLEKVHNQFLQYGIKSMTMDDISRGMGISKKTLYKYVKDKSDLVAQVMQYSLDCDEKEISEIAEKQDHPIDEIIAISSFVSRKLSHMKPSVIYDLVKYYPEAWDKFSKYKLEFIRSCITRNLELGKKSGWYRSNLDSGIVSGLFISLMDAMLNPTVFTPNQNSLVEIHSEFIRYHIRGVASDKGKSYLEEKVKKEKLKW